MYAQYTNTVHAISSLFKSFNIAFSKQQLKEDLLSHPDYPSLFIINVFRAFFSRSLFNKLTMEKKISVKFFIVLIYLIVVSHLTLYSQSFTSKAFTIYGKIKDVDTGRVTLIYSDTSLKIPNREVKTLNGEFTMEGSIPYPHAVRIMYKSRNNRMISNYFFIEQGKNNIIVPSVDSMGMLPPVNDFSMLNNEYLKNCFPLIYNVLKSLYKFYDEYWEIRQKYKNNIPLTILDSMNKIEEKYIDSIDNISIAYIQSHKNSFISFWILNELLHKRGYNKIYEGAFNILEDSIKSSYSYKNAYNYLGQSKSMNIGQSFKSITLPDIKDQAIDIKDILSKNKYTIIDFWYSKCGPCRRQFPMLLKMYKKFKNQGLEIVSISTDTKEDKSLWKEVIKKEKLTWLQMLDENGKQSYNMSINVYPTTFLVDKTGKIIDKNLEMEKLENILSDLLK